MTLACNPSTQEAETEHCKPAKTYSEMGFLYAWQEMTGTIDHVKTLVEAKHSNSRKLPNQDEFVATKNKDFKQLEQTERLII